MSDEIKPALSAEAWKDIAVMIPFISLEGTPQAAIALANATLPDDSPYKIARADVDFLEWVAEQMRQMNPISMEDEAALERLAAKLAALLPPEDV